MKARIGIAESSKVIEIEIEDPAQFKLEMEEAISASHPLSWFTDTKKRTVGVPGARIAFVEIDSESDSHTIGFTPGE
ncbi:MAG: DUF3107 family protein [Acidimicrobiia bacterium]